MTYIATQGKFHVALDGVGLLLQGAPNAPAYKMTNAPVYGTRFASGDRDYNDLSQWWYLIQTDWSGGIKETFSFLDDAKFYYSTNIDARSKPGKLILDKAIVQVWSNVANSNAVRDVRNYSWGNGHTETIAIDNDLLAMSTTLLNDSSLNSVGFAVAFKKNLWAFDRGGVNGRVHYTAETTAAPYSFTSVEGNINSIIDGSSAEANVGVNVGDTTLYVLGKSTTDNMYIVKTTSATGAAFTLVKEWSADASGESVAGALQFGNTILFLTEGSGFWTLYSLDLTTEILTVVNRFDTGDQFGIWMAGGRYLQLFKGKVLITFLTDGQVGEGAIYTWDGTTLEKIYQTDRIKNAFSTPEATTRLRGGAVIFDDCAFWGNLVLDSEWNFFNFIKTIDDDNTVVLIPIGTDGVYLYLADNEVTSGDQQAIVWKYDKRASATSFKTGASHSAFAVFSLHDKLQSIDKLLNTMTIGFDQFLSGQSIAIYYTTNPLPDPDLTTGGWTLLGTASYTLDGAVVTSKVFPFPVGTTAKKIWFRAELVGGGSNTPGLTDYTLEYLPVPDYKKEWTININCADEVKRLDGRLVETTARELKSRMERMWWTKSALDYQDVDYATTTVNDASFDATETTVTVASTADFPEQGRIKVDSEEILYTGKTPTSFTGCTRGARGTRAATHADASVANNAYKVIVMGVQETTPILLEDKNLEYIMGLSLREV